MMRAAHLLTALGITALASACGGGGAEEGAQGDTFLAFPSTFQSFRSWEAFALTGQEIPNSPHTSGPRTVYLKARPAHGATEFPVGTVIVKEFAADGKIFAMVKRGGSYNTTGAKGWEWFELTTPSDTAVTIAWRGVGPPAGEKYGGDPNGGCNGCHGGARTNDFVQTAPLTLSNF